MGATSWTERRRVTAARQRFHVVDTAVATIEGFRRHRTGRNAALLAHYGFLSVFPLILAMTTVLGFVLQSDANLRARIVGSTLSNLPIVGQQIATDPTRLQGSVVVLVVSLLGSLWSGTKAFVALQNGLNDIADVPLDERPNLAHTRVRSLAGIAVIGGAQVGTPIIVAVIGATGVAVVEIVLLLAATVLINAAVLAASYRWLCARDQPWRDLLPGAAVGGVTFAGLQLVGVAVVARAISKATPAYGTFASVIGLLGWLALHAYVALLGAELNGALKKPTTITNRGDTTSAP